MQMSRKSEKNAQERNGCSAHTQDEEDQKKIMDRIKSFIKTIKMFVQIFPPHTNWTARGVSVFYFWVGTHSTLFLQTTIIKLALIALLSFARIFPFFSLDSYFRTLCFFFFLYVVFDSNNPTYHKCHSNPV